MRFLRVKLAGHSCWHYALETELRPVCACGCKTAGIPRKKGDTACKCPCHAFGMKSLSLCEKLLAKKAVKGVLMKLPAVQTPLFRETQKPKRRKAWTVVVGRGKGCQTCIQLATKLYNEEVRTVKS